MIKILFLERNKKMKIAKNIIFISIVCILVILSLGQVSKAADTYYQYVKTGINQFPSSYQERLKQLASKYPNWKFQAYYTGISWNELIQNERDESVHRNRVTNNAPKSWKNSCGYVYDGWACASDAIVAYYLDPRNFLNNVRIFQFEGLSYDEKTNSLTGIEKILYGTEFYNRIVQYVNSSGNTITMSKKYSDLILRPNVKVKDIFDIVPRGTISKSGMDFHTGIFSGMLFPEDIFEKFDYISVLKDLNYGKEITEKADSAYTGKTESYKNALSVLRWNCGYPLPDAVSGNTLQETVKTKAVNEILDSIEISIKYRGYIEREQKLADKIMRLEHLSIPDGFDFDRVESLSIECRQKLKKYAPKTIAQASRISGVSPADISVLLVYFGR